MGAGGLRGGANSELLTRRDRLAFPVPTGELARQVLGYEVKVHEFLYGGYIVAEALREVLDLIGRPLSSFSRVLDLGCGSGRVLRWFGPESAACQFLGSDISEGAIAWNRQHMPFGEYHVNGASPPLALPDESVDLAYAVSVVTHIDEPLQLAWLRELQRVLRPGGILILTASTEDIASWKLPAEDFAAFRTKGHCYKRVAEGGLHGLPDFYQDAYHSREYIERVWYGFFRPRAHVRYGPMFLQDLILMEKENPAGRSSERAPTWLDLPMCALGAPMIGDVVGEEPVGLTGWAFHPSGSTERVDVWLDEVRVATLRAELPTPAVGNAFPLWPSARACGFELWLDVSGLGPGAHRLKIAPRTNLVATVSSYLVKEP